MDISYYSGFKSKSNSNGHAKKNTMEKKSNIKRCKVISMVLLPIDLMIDIISQVSLKCLCNSKRYVRKPCATVIGSSHFAEAQHAHSKPGLYVEDLNSKTNIKSLFLLLPEDLMIDIFSRVSLECVLNSARYVCKPWAAIIGSSHFAEAQHAHSKLGFYVEDLNSKTNSYFMDIKDDLNGHFERIDLGMPPEMPQMGRLIGTCGGLLLFSCYNEQIFVLNPLLKCCLKVPPPPPTRRQLIRSRLIIARVTRPAIFKLFYVDILEVLGAQWYVFYVLKIGIDNSWKEIARIKDTDGPRSIFIEFSDLESVYSGGNDLYWITTKVVMVMDVDKETIVGEYSLSSPMLLVNCLSREFLWMENQLSCIVKERETTTLKIYILDTDSRKWTLYDEMRPLEYVFACGRMLQVAYKRFRFWLNGQLVIHLFLYQSGKIIKIYHVYDVKTRWLTKIEGIPMDDFEVWLHTNSLAWPSTST